MPAINEILQQGRYRVVREFERPSDDTAAAFYEACDNHLGTNVLLRENLIKLNKVTTAAQREAFRLAFEREARALTLLKHESLLEVRDYFSDIDRQYLVSEAPAGENFARLLEKNRRPFALSEVGVWTDQMLDALGYLHAQNPPVIYGRLKPENMTRGASGRIKLFIRGGLNERADGAENKSAANPSELPYLPLEQIWSGLDPASQKVVLNGYDEKSERILESPADARSDVYSLGATVYHLLTAHAPIDALTRSIDILEGQNDPLPAPARLNPDVPAAISEILLKALEIKRENRFESAAAMRHAWRAAFARLKEQRAAAEKAKPVETAGALATATLSNAVAPSQTPNLTQTESIERQAAAGGETVELKLEAEAPAGEKLLENAERREIPAKETIESAAAAATVAEIKGACEQTANESFAVDGDYARKSVSADEPGFLFAAAPPRKNDKTFRQMSVAAAILIIFVGTVLGGWFLLKSNPAESSPVAAEPEVTFSEKTQPAPVAETPDIETKTETDAAPAATTNGPTEETFSGETTPAAIQNKAAAPRVKKPLTAAASRPPQPTTPAAAKTPAAAQKKVITVDDLINDN